MASNAHPAVLSTPVVRQIYRLYRKLPFAARAPLRCAARPVRSAITAALRATTGGRVFAGPFRGMALASSANTPHAYAGFLAGTHEIELVELLERVVARRYASIINVGAADGYYAVGLARRLPESHIVAFESDGALHPHLRKVARLNGIEPRITIHGHCGVVELTRALEASSRPTFILIDIEGGEVEVLDPARVPQLRGVDMMIETHDGYVRDCTRTLLSRFSATHFVERVRGRPRSLSDFPAELLPLARRVLPGTLVAMIDEGREIPQDWLFLTARNGCS